MLVVNEENGYESSVDNDDDISSDDDPDLENKLEAEVGQAKYICAVAEWLPHTLLK